jgi:hypothetical protein
MAVGIADCLHNDPERSDQHFILKSQKMTLEASS